MTNSKNKSSMQGQEEDVDPCDEQSEREDEQNIDHQIRKWKNQMKQ